MQYAPVLAWMMEKKGSKQVEISVIDDKRQITAVFGFSMSGTFFHQYSFCNKETTTSQTLHMYTRYTCIYTKKKTENT